MSTKEEAKERAAVLAGLREKHADSVAQSQTLLKEQNALRKQLKKVLKEGPKTVPDLAAETDLPADQVLWHITAMKKYDLVVESGMNDDGEYYLYALPD